MSAKLENEEIVWKNGRSCINADVLKTQNTAVYLHVATAKDVSMRVYNIIILIIVSFRLVISFSIIIYFDISRTFIVFSNMKFPQIV